MKRYTHYALSTLLTLVLGGAAFGLSDAQTRGRGPGGPGFGGPGRMGFPGVELTDAQREQINAIFDAERAARQEQPAGFDLHRQIRLELLADNPDEQKIAALRDQLAAAQAQRLAQEIALQQKIAAVLTPEQRAQAREALANAPERRRGAPGGAGLGFGPGPRH